MLVESTLKAVHKWVGRSRQWVIKFLETAPDNASIVAVVVMGSAIRERVHRRSDLDLLVVYRGSRPVVKAPLEVDVRLHSVDRLEEQLVAGHEVVCWAVKYGKPLYDPLGVWDRLVSSWSGRLPLPSAQQATERARSALARAHDMIRVGDESAADDLLLSALTQFVRQRLLEQGVFPASRPELPGQLRRISPRDPLAQLLEDAMFGELAPQDAIRRIEAAGVA